MNVDLQTEENRKTLTQRLAFGLFTILSASVVIILFVILGFIIYRGGKVLSWDFITQFPKDGMTTGGIYPAIIGTLYLVVGSSLISFPIDRKSVV